MLMTARSISSVASAQSEDISQHVWKKCRRPGHVLSSTIAAKAEARSGAQGARRCEVSFGVGSPLEFVGLTEILRNGIDVCRSLMQKLIVSYRNWPSLIVGPKLLLWRNEGISCDGYQVFGGRRENPIFQQ
eukprot:914673-Rhodomonas_salina.1